MSAPIPEQVDYFINMLASQDLKEIVGLHEYVLRSRLNTVTVVARLLKSGVDVFDVTGESTKKAMEDMKAGRFFTLELDADGNILLVKNQEFPDD